MYKCYTDNSGLTSLVKIISPICGKLTFIFFALAE